MDPCFFGPPEPPDPTLPARRLEVATMLLAAGADPDGHGNSPVQYAAYRGELPLVELLLKAGANPDGRLEEWKTPLMYAAAEGHLGCCRALVAAGADIHWLNKDGANALSEAVGDSQPAVVRWLLEMGANPSMGRVFFDSKETLLHYAQSNNRPEIAALLEAAMIDDH
jgi:ankyrin repeat protein